MRHQLTRAAVLTRVGPSRDYDAPALLQHLGDEQSLMFDAYSKATAYCRENCIKLCETFDDARDWTLEHNPSLAFSLATA